MGRAAALALAALAAIGIAAPARAHPHVMVDVHALVEFKNGKIVSLFMGWKFDPIYSATLVQDFDKNKNGKLDADEIRMIEAEAFRDTKDQGYFTYAMADGKPVTWASATDFSIVGMKDALLYAFRLNFPEPLDPRKSPVSLTTYEETFYIDMDFPNDKAVSLTGEGSAGCKAVIAPDHGNTIFGGIVTPKRATIRCD